MLRENEGRPHVEGGRVNRVSSAVWPVKVRKVVATGRAAQRRRDWIIQGSKWVILANALAMQVLLIVTTLLVVVSSLVVAFLGLRFWYLLFFPLLLFATLLMASAFIARCMPIEKISTFFALKMRSSTEIGSTDAQKLKSQIGMLSLKRNRDILADGTPVTPMPVDQPVEGILETYNMRAKPSESFLANVLEEETGGHSLYATGNNFWMQIATPNPLETGGLAYRRLCGQIWDEEEMAIQKSFRSEQHEL